MLLKCLEPTVDEMDVSGIDFDDDFEAAEQKTESVATKMVNESLNEMDTSAEWAFIYFDTGKLVNLF